MDVGEVKPALGFTLIELLITILLVSVLVTIAIPSFRGFANNSLFASEVNDFIVGLSYARSEATKNRESFVLRVRQEEGSPWEMEVFPLSRDNQEDQVLARVSRDSRVTVSGGEEIVVVFNPLGRRSVCEADSSELSPCAFGLSFVEGYSRGFVVGVNGSVY